MPLENINNNPNEFLFELINDIDEFVFFKDIELRYQFVNDAFCRFLNKSKSELIGKNDFEIFPADEAFAIREIDTQVINTNKPISFELQVSGYNKKVWTSVNKYPIIQEEKLIGIKSIVRITDELKRKQTELTENEAILTSFFDSGSLMRGVVEIVKNDILHVFDNLNTINFFGLKSKDSTRNKFASELGIPADHIQLWLKNYIQSFNTGKPVQFEYEHYSDNKLYTLNATVSFLGISESGHSRFAYTVEDITKKKLIEKTIIDSENRYRAIFEGTNDGIVVADSATGKLIYANNVFCKMFGYQKSDLFSLKFKDLHPLAFTEEASKHFVDASGDENRVLMNIPCQHRNGTIFYCDVKDSKVIINGRLCNVAFMSNVMGRRRIESVLQRHNAALQASANGIIITDKNGIINFVNKSFENITGYKSEEAVGKNPSQLVRSGLNSSELYKSLWETISKGEVWKGVLVNKRKDGDLFYQEMMVTPFYDNMDNSMYFIAIQSDITDKINTQKELAETYTLLKNLSNRIPGAIYQYQLFKDGSSCFPYSSERIYDIYEVTSEQVHKDATLVYARLHPEDFDEIVESIQNSAKTLELWKLDYRVILPQKGMRWLRGSALPEKLEDESVLWHGYIHDITDRKEQELKLIASESKFRSYIENSPIAIMIWDGNGNLLDTNSYSTKLFGYSIEEFKSKKFSDLINLKFSTSFNTDLERLYSENFANFDLKLNKKDNSVFWANIKAVKLDDGNYLVFCSDITERSNYLDEIKKISFEFEKVFNNTQNAMFLIEVSENKELKYVRNNKVHQEKKGYSAEKFVGKSPIELLGEEQGKKLMTFYNKCINERISITFDDNQIFTNQSRYWQTTLTPVFDNDEIKFIVGSSVDLSELKAAENALKLREEQLLTLINASSDIICFKDGSGRWLEANKAQLDLFMLQNVDYHYKTDIELASYTPFFRNSLNECFISDELAWKNKTETRSLELIPIPNGTVKYFDIIKVPLFHTNGNRNGLVLLGRDITDRIKIEKINEESLSRLSVLIESMSQGILFENSDSEIMMVNPTFCKFFGISNTDSIIGMNCRTAAEYSKVLFVNPDAFIIQIDKIISEGMIVTNELLELQDGRYFERDFIPVYSNNELKGKYWIYRDVTEIKNSEKYFKEMAIEIRKQNEIIETSLYQKNSLIEELTEIRNQLIKTNDEKDKFLSILAHDLKSPFSGFLGLTQILAEQFEDLSMDNLMEIGKNMSLSASNLYKLLENLLAWANVMQGNIDFNKEKIQLFQVVEDTEKINRPNLELKSIKLENKVRENLFVYADLRMLETVVRNLISNALKFSNRNGVIIVDAIENNEYVEISVSDNGIGMDNKLMNDLFVLSKKTKRFGTEGENSTGLGLILCKEFIELHKGKIWVESEIDLGTTFYFSLPK